MANIVKIQFHTAEKLYDFNSAEIELKPGDRVIVETDRGRSMALVATAPSQIPDELVPEFVKTILRKATPADLEAAEKNSAREKETFAFCQAKIAERNLDMKLVKVEYIFDGSKAIFYFTADGRIDFRDLVKDLAQQFHTRIEMKQIGVRDEAKIVGGTGICGRELCCSTFLRDFAPVSVKMAKEQNLALNPVKISGQCGRLLCCLGYEFETYCELRKGLPKCGKHMKCCGAEGEVIKVNTLTRTFTMKTTDSRILQFTPEDMEKSDPDQASPAKEATAPPAPAKAPSAPTKTPSAPAKTSIAEKPSEKLPQGGEKEKTGSTGRRRIRKRHKGQGKKAQDTQKETP